VSEATYRQAWSEATADNERLTREIRRVRKQLEEREHILDRLQYAINDFVCAEEHFLEELRCKLNDLRTALELLKGCY